MRSSPLLSLALWALPFAATAQNALLEETTEEAFIPAYTAGSAFYSYTGEADFDDAGEGALHQQEGSFRFDYPYFRGDALTLTAGLRYRFNRFEFEDAAFFGERDLDLHRIEAPVQAFVDNGRWKYWFRFEPGIGTDFEDSPGSDAFKLSVLGLASYSFTEKFSGAVGAFYSNELGESTILPVAGFIYKPDPTLSISLTVPRMAVAYAPSADWIFSLSAYPSGGSWEVSDPEDEGESSEFNFGSVRAAASVDYRLGDGPAWVFVDAGVQFLQNVEVIRDGPDFDEDAGAAPFVNVGFKLRF